MSFKNHQKCFDQPSKSSNRALKLKRTSDRVTRNGFREPPRLSKKKLVQGLVESFVPHNDEFALDETQTRTAILIPSDIPKGWSNPQMLGYRNDVEGKQCFEELKTAIAFLSEQGCGDPHFIPVFGVLKLTRKQMREGLEIFDGSMKEKREFLNPMRWGMTGEPNVHLNRDIDVLGAAVVGAHAVFDYSEPVSEETFTTRPYLRVDIRLNIPLECRVDGEDGETLREWDGTQIARVDIPSSVLFAELEEIAA